MYKIDRYSTVFFILLFEILKNFNEVQKEELEYFKKPGSVSADDMKTESKGEDDFDW